MPTLLRPLGAEQRIAVVEADWTVTKGKDSEVRLSGDLAPLLTNYVNERKSSNIFVSHFPLL